MNFVISDELFESKEGGEKYVLLISSSYDKSVKMAGLKLETLDLCTSNPPQIQKQIHTGIITIEIFIIIISTIISYILFLLLFIIIIVFNKIIL